MMDYRSYGQSGSSSSANPNGFYYGVVKAVDGDTVTVQVPRLFGGAQIPGIPVVGATPSVDDSVFISFIEGRRGALLAFPVEATGGATGDITAVAAGTNLNGGGTSGDVTLNLDDDISVTSVTGNLYGPSHISVKNTSGGALAKGTAVYATGSVGASGAVEVQASDNTNSSTMPALGLLDEALNNGDTGSATIFGVVRQMDTSSYAINDELWINGSGTLQDTRPTSGLIQKIGRVVRVHATTGEILVMGAGRTNDVPFPLFADHVNQRVGIGTTSPATALDVSGTVTATAFSGPLTGAVTGNASTATALETARTIDITGDITATAVAFDGTSNIAISAAVNNDSHTHDTQYVKLTGSTMTGELQLNARLDVGNGSDGNHEIRIYKADNNDSDHIQFYNGTTRVGEIGCEDTTWLRINQETAKNIYTPRMMRADGGYQAKDGTKASPGYTFVNDPNTGMYRYGTERIGFSAGDKTVMLTQNNSAGLSGASSRSFSLKAAGAAEFVRETTGSTNGIMALYSNYSATNNLVWLVYADGDTASDTGSYGTISDNRLKTNITQYHDPTDDLMAINVIKYDLSKTSTGVDEDGEPILVDRAESKTMTGWEAQQVQSVKPGFVKLDNERGTLSVKSSVFTPLLHRGFQVHEGKIQALQAENDELIATAQTQSALIESLEARIEALEAQ